MWKRDPNNGFRKDPQAQEYILRSKEKYLWPDVHVAEHLGRDLPEHWQYCSRFMLAVRMKLKIYLAAVLPIRSFNLSPGSGSSCYDRRSFKFALTCSYFILNKISIFSTSNNILGEILVFWRNYITSKISFVVFAKYLCPNISNFILKLIFKYIFTGIYFWLNIIILGYTYIIFRRNLFIYYL